MFVCVCMCLCVSVCAGVCACTRACMHVDAIGAIVCYGSTKALALDIARSALETDLKIEREWRGTLQRNLEQEKERVAGLQEETRLLQTTRKVCGSSHIFFFPLGPLQDGDHITILSHSQLFTSDLSRSLSTVPPSYILSTSSPSTILFCFHALFITHSSLILCMCPVHCSLLSVLPTTFILRFVFLSCHLQ